MSNQLPNTTTDAGMPVPSDEYSLTIGPGGPNLLQDAYLIEKLAHFVRERIPDRVYHVKGGGAFGYLCSVARYSRKFSHVNCDGSFGTESWISSVSSIC
jgi:catalase